MRWSDDSSQRRKTKITLLHVIYILYHHILSRFLVLIFLTDELLIKALGRLVALELYPCCRTGESVMRRLLNRMSAFRAC